ncbi:hypothetical protein HGRIS_007459 [Hohenbuehelia grisea]|uniref:Ferritin-like domain-containing protein n=1 Tax=Hohenbuehelia grisea TaxID=104357 RepID=A0ABR3J4W8_9AGAR
MKTVFALAAIVIASSAGVRALPQQPEARAAVDDATILNYALTLEHLENAFYAGALAKFDEKAFAAAGLPPWARGRFVQVGKHEQQHVEFLSAALGDKATKPCEYKFPYTDPKSFAALSQVLEGVGVSAYAGAAQFITNKDYLTAAASVLSTEARHASWVAAAVNRVAGWSGAFDVPLGLNEVYTLAASFITSCPSSNPALPVKAFPALALQPAAPKPGQRTTLKFDVSGVDKSTKLYAAFYTGLDKKFAEIQNNQVTVPAGLEGNVYAVVSKSSGPALTDEDVVAGPAILQFNFDSQGRALS